jgi:putative glycerol-1-phosphate prenyltransferase
MGIAEEIRKKQKLGKKQFALLIDPDSASEGDVIRLCQLASEANVDMIFVGGSLMTNGSMDKVINSIHSNCNISAVIFPGDPSQVSSNADAILFLSVISGRNPEMLIGRHVMSAPVLKRAGIEVIPTGYMLIDSGTQTTASYMSGTTPIPHDKNDIAACTALAGEMLGLNAIFMDGGSGAKNPISEEMIATVKSQISVPLFTGGGIRTPEKALANCKAGADVIVVGNAIEKDPSLLSELATAIHSC